MGSRRGFRTALAFAASSMVALLAISGSANGATKTKTISSGDIDMTIPGMDIATSMLKVRPKGRIKDVKVNVRISHQFVDDVFLLLVDPRGNPVNLSTGNGGDGDDYGTGSTDCGGSFTTFSDAAATPITAGLAPFGGSFMPETPFADLKGGKTQGGWRLHAIDGDGPTGGTLHCWELEIKYRTP